MPDSLLACVPAIFVGAMIGGVVGIIVSFIKKWSLLAIVLVVIWGCLVA